MCKWQFLFWIFLSAQNTQNRHSMNCIIVIKIIIIISYHIISYHIISYHIISYHIIYHIISYHITSHHNYHIKSLFYYNYYHCYYYYHYHHHHNYHMYITINYKAKHSCIQAFLPISFSCSSFTIMERTKIEWHLIVGAPCALTCPIHCEWSPTVFAHCLWQSFSSPAHNDKNI